MSVKNNYYLDSDGNPDGGVSEGTGFTISWQRGPLGSGLDRSEQNGAFVEDLLETIIGRLEFYQATKFNCTKNDYTLAHLYQALESQKSRMRDHEIRGI